MVELDLNAMTISELKQLEKDVARAIVTYEQRRITDARTDLEAYAKKLGFKLSDLLDVPQPRKIVATEPKYVNPDNASQTWSGRGRQPFWVKDALAAGKSLGDLAID